MIDLARLREIANRSIKEYGLVGFNIEDMAGAHPEGTLALLDRIEEAERAMKSGDAKQALDYFGKLHVQERDHWKVRAERAETELYHGPQGQVRKLGAVEKTGTKA